MKMKENHQEEQCNNCSNELDKEGLNNLLEGILPKYEMFDLVSVHKFGNNAYQIMGMVYVQSVQSYEYVIAYMGNKLSNFDVMESDISGVIKKFKTWKEQ